MQIEDIRSHLQKPFLSVFLDGRNKHGSHVLPMPGDRIGDLDEITSLLESQGDGVAEQIISDAEGLGFEINHCVVTVWGHERADNGAPTYWEYVEIDPILTDLLYGTPESQNGAFAAAEAGS